ncbi:MAG TPA: branched-chain amino acid ABC transporter permease [Longimicrobium sp.]|jgi:branched-chain amino acid transport system permease protein|nr:branched-chain amino acid ABC transporter permease [Longimicrobium sp.]
MYAWHLLLLLSFYMALALSLNLVIGYLGQFSLGHAVYALAGAYAYAFATIEWEASFVTGLGLALCIGAAGSLLLSIPARRLGGDQFMMASLAVHMLLFTAAYNWWSPGAPYGSWANLTNGPFGVSGIPPATLPGVGMLSPTGTAAAAAIFTLGLLVVLALLLRSPWGRLLRALRDDELAARALGKNAGAAKLRVFAVACSAAAGAGAVFAAYMSYVDPNLATLDEAVLLVAMVVVGGAGNLRGPIVGSFLLVLIPEALRTVGVTSATAASLRLVAFGALLILFMFLRPSGLAGDYALDR